MCRVFLFLVGNLAVSDNCYRYLHRLELLRQAQEKLTTWGIELTGKQSAAIELTRRDHSTDIRLHYHYKGIRELPKFACDDYH